MATKFGQRKTLTEECCIAGVEVMHRSSRATRGQYVQGQKKKEKKNMKGRKTMKKVLS